jgi:hypothetical protein
MPIPSFTSAPKVPPLTTTGVADWLEETDEGQVLKDSDDVDAEGFGEEVILVVDPDDVVVNVVVAVVQ